jgi:hypothetical protein
VQLLPKWSHLVHIPAVHHDLTSRCSAPCRAGLPQRSLCPQSPHGAEPEPALHCCNGAKRAAHFDSHPCAFAHSG